MRAVNKAGRSPAASADYLAARTTHAWVFATDTRAHAVVRVRVHGGRLRTVTPSGTAWAVNSQGDVYVVDRDAHTVSRTKASGTHARTRVIATGLTNLSAVQLDAAGQVYVVAGTQVIRMSAAGARPTVVADPESGSVFVQRDGTVVSTAGDNESTPLQIVSYPPGGGTPAVRTLPSQNTGPYSPSSVIGDRAGNLYLHWISNGGGDFNFWYRLAAGSSTRTPLFTRWANYAFTVGGDGRPYLAQTEAYCDTIAIAEGVCTPDHTVNEILRYAADGTPTAVLIQPFENDQWDLSPGHALAADRAGRLFVAQASGPSAGLREYPATGGEATVLAAGTFTDVARNN